MKQLAIGDVSSDNKGYDAVVSFINDGDLNFDILDIPSTNIIDLFEQCNAFCNLHNSILFKCQAGMSRSCSFLIAYLMHSESKSLKDAMLYCKSIRPQLAINKGFLYQLQLYESMNNSIDIWNPEYRKFKAWINLQNRESKKLNVNEFGQDPHFLETLPPNLPVIKCKQCRRKLAIFIKDYDHQTCSGNIIIEPLQWMNVEQLQGKLYCPRCQCKIGSYLWQGIQCQCSKFIAPYFTLSPNKVDVQK